MAKFVVKVTEDGVDIASYIAEGEELSPDQVIAFQLCQMAKEMDWLTSQIRDISQTLDDWRNQQV